MTRFFGSFSSWWDKWIIDGIGVNGPAIIAKSFSYPVKLLQWGLVQWYALVMVMGLAVLLSAEMGLWWWLVGWIVGTVLLALLYLLWQRFAPSAPSR
jgi:hypothetical protein